MREYKLYCFHYSGNSYKVAQYLNLVGADWEPKFVDFRIEEMKSIKFRKSINVQGEVPVLEHMGKRISQSGVILNYLVDRFEQFGWSNDTERYEILRWLLFDNNKLTNHVATHRYGHFVSPGAYHPAVMVYLRARITEAFAVLESHLENARFVLGGDCPTIADFSISGYLLYPVEELGLGDNIWAAYPSIADWLSRIRALPSWKSPYDILPSR